MRAWATPPTSTSRPPRRKTRRASSTSASTGRHSTWAGLSRARRAPPVLPPVKHLLKRAFVAALAGACAAAALAQAPGPRPKIALVLGAGGAHGGDHSGVLE